MPAANADTTLQLPEALPPPPRPPRRPRLVLAAATAGAIAVGALGFALVADDGGVKAADVRVTGSTVPTTVAPPAPSSDAPPVPRVVPRPPAKTPPTPPATTKPAPRERLSADSRLRLDGIGPVAVGMTLQEASTAAGMPIRTKPGDHYGPECEYAYPAEGLDDLAFMVFNGRIARVDVGHLGPGRVKTISGIGKGSTEDEVKRAYPGRITVQGHPYTTGGHYLLYTPADAGAQHLGMIFETDGQRVTTFRSGLKNAVGQIEGCS